MKIKKLYTCFICYLTLIAFISVISLELSFNSDFLNKKTEISANKSNTANNLNLVFEEETDTDDLIDYSLISQLNFIGSSFLSFNTINYINQSIKNQPYKFSFKSPLFISFRALRI
ncbi:MAG: hypothetical protein WCH21_08720 [Bacteroidota bacterium]